MGRWTPARSDVLADYAAEVLRVYPRGRILVGVDGLDGVGKTTFARDLVAAVRAAGVDAAGVSLDAFQSPLDRRGVDDERAWYEGGFDYAALRERVIVPYRAGSAVVLAHRDIATDALIEVPPTWTPAERAVLVVEGIFLLRPEVRGLWHTTALLQVDPDVAFARCVARDGWDPAPDAVLNRVFFAAERRYYREVDPAKAAVATFDLTDAAHPRRVFADAC